MLMQNKDLKGSLSWTQFLSFNQFLYTEWRIIPRTTELLSHVFTILRGKIFDRFKKIYINIFRKKISVGGFLAKKKTEQML